VLLNNKELELDSLSMFRIYYYLHKTTVVLSLRTEKRTGIGQSLDVVSRERDVTSWFFPLPSMACCAITSPAPNSMPAVIHWVIIGRRNSRALTIERDESAIASQMLENRKDAHTCMTL